MAAPAPWAQRVNGWARRVSPWLVYLLGFAWMAWLFLGGLGAVDPVKAIERAYGKGALQLLAATLAVTPLRRLSGVMLVRFRRALGLMAFWFVAGHFAVWAVLDVQRLDAVWADIVKRPFITIGMAALLLLLPLAATSSDAALRRIGPVLWRRIHWLTYPAVALGAVHYVMLTKTWNAEPLLYLAMILALLSTRLPWRRLASLGGGSRWGTSRRREAP